MSAPVRSVPDGDGVPTVATFGETMALLTAPGMRPLRYAPELRVSVGGTESNLATGLVRLGVPTAWFGRVGDDEFGQRVLTVLRGEGVDVSAATMEAGAPTGLMIKSTPSAGRTAIVYYRSHSAASRLHPDHLDEDAIRDARVLHVTGTTAGLSESARATVHASIDVAQAAGTLVSLDPNHREGVWPAAEAGPHLREIARRADIVLVGDDEAPLLVDQSSSPEAVVRALAALGPSQTVLKRGADGAMALIDGEFVAVSAAVTTVVDVVGAGDAFGAGYLAALLDGAAPHERLRTAAAVAGRIIAAEGDWEGLPTRDDLATALATEVVR